MDQKNNFLIRIFGILELSCMMLLFLPIISNMTNGKARFYTLTSIIIYGVGIILAYVVLNEGYLNKRRAGFILCGTIAIGIVLRIVCNFFLQTQQVSDFLTPHNFYEYFQEHGGYNESGWDTKDFYQKYYTRAPAWYAYMRIIMALYNIFGKNVKIVLFVNYLLAIGTMLIIYYAMKKIAGRKSGIIAVGLFAFCPSLIMYSSITNPDHFFMFFISLLILAWLMMEDSRKVWMKNKRIFVIWAFVFALLTAILNCFKPVTAVIITALICYEIVCSIYPAISARMQWKTIFQNIITCELTVLLLVCCVGVITNKALESSIENMFKTEVVESNTGYYIYAGFALDEEGHYRAELATERLQELTKENNGNQVEAMAQMWPEAISQLRTYSFSEVLEILKMKIDVITNEYGYFGFSNTSANEEYKNNIVNILQTPVLQSARSYMQIIYLISVLGGLAIIFQKRTSKSIVFMMIIVFGYLCLLLVGYAQGRYKSNILPLWFMVVSYFVCIGFPNIVCDIRKYYNRVKEKCVKSHG